MKHRRVIEYAAIDRRTGGVDPALLGLADTTGLPGEVVVELARRNELRRLFNPATRRLEHPQELRRRHENATLTAATPRDAYQLRREVQRKRFPPAVHIARRRAQLAAKRVPAWQVDAENLGYLTRQQGGNDREML